MADADYADYADWARRLVRGWNWMDCIPLVTRGSRSIDPQRHSEDVRSPGRRVNVSEGSIRRLDELRGEIEAHAGGWALTGPTAADAAYGASLAAASQAAIQMAVSMNELRSLFAQLREQATWASQADARIKPVTEGAHERAKALLDGILTSGERLILEGCGYVPVIGSQTGDLWLVSRKPVYNLARYERPPPGYPAPVAMEAIPVLWCAAAAALAPVEDLTSSLLISLRSAEGLVIDVANRLPVSSVAWAPLSAYRRLRALARCRCRDEGLVGYHLNQARKGVAALSDPEMAMARHFFSPARASSGTWP